MDARPVLRLLLAVGLLSLLASPALALQAGTRCQFSAGNGLLGIADGIPGDLEDRFDNLPTPLVNDVHDDDALTCVLSHTTNATVNTMAEWVIELGNTTAHEVGHLVSLLHSDDAGNDDLMNGPYNGVDKGFGATSLNLLHNSLNDSTQLVWVDFDAASAELPALYQGHGLAGATQFGALNTLQLNIIKANIISQIRADYNGGAAFNANFTLTFTMNMPAAGTYSTISFITPEPSAMMLLGFGLLAVKGVASRMRKR